MNRVRLDAASTLEVEKLLPVGLPMLRVLAGQQNSSYGKQVLVFPEKVAQLVSRMPVAPLDVLHQVLQGFLALPLVPAVFGAVFILNLVLLVLGRTSTFFG